MLEPTHVNKSSKSPLQSGNSASLNPVLIDEDDRIIAGHGRVAAAKLLDLVQVQSATTPTTLSPTQKRAYILADNRLAEKAGWDEEILVVELQGLLDDGFEVVLTGFEVPDVDVVLDAAAEAKSDRHGDDLSRRRVGCFPLR